LPRLILGALDRNFTLKNTLTILKWNWYNGAKGIRMEKRMSFWIVLILLSALPLFCFGKDQRESDQSNISTDKKVYKVREYIYNSNKKWGESDFKYVPELNEVIAVFPTVWRISRESEGLRKVLNKNDLSWAENVLDIGTGTGILGLIALKQGAKKVIGTDINPNAVDNARYNAKKLGYDNVFEVRLVSKNNPKAYSVIKKEEEFDLIISDLPYGEGKPANSIEYAVLDENRLLLRSLLAGIESHLTKNGKAWILMGGEDNISLVLALASKHALKAVLIDVFEQKIPVFAKIGAVIELTRK